MTTLSRQPMLFSEEDASDSRSPGEPGSPRPLRRGDTRPDPEPRARCRESHRFLVRHPEHETLVRARWTANDAGDEPG